MKRSSRRQSFVAAALFVGSSPGTANSASAQTQPAAFTTYYRYDLVGRVVGTISADPDGAGPLAYLATRSTYDPDGRVVKVESGSLSTWQGQDILPQNWVGFTAASSKVIAYDLSDREITETSAGSDGLPTALIQYSYDPTGGVKCSALRMNPAGFSSPLSNPCVLGTEGSNGSDRISVRAYDAAGQLVQIRKAVGTTVEGADASYTYTANGKQAQVIDAEGNRAELRYDGFDRQVRWVFPSTIKATAYNDSSAANAIATAGASNEGDYEAYTYDPVGNRTSLRKRDGSVLSYTFDNLNRVLTKTVPERSGLDPSYTQDVYYSYDQRGLMTTARFNGFTSTGVKFIYDGFGRMTGSINQLITGGGWVNNQYDANGNRTRMTYPDTNFVTYDYDGLDRPDCILMASTTTCAAAQAMNKVASYAYNSIGQRIGFNGAVTTSYGYDPAGRLTTLTNNLAASTYNNQWTFGFNPAGQIMSNARTNDTFAWTGAVNVNRDYTTNGLNQYTAAGTAAFCYDANGNLTADGSSVYLYDIENRLVEKRAQGTGNSNCAALSYAGALQAGLRYDPLGRLYEVTGSSGTTRMLYDGDALTAEYDTGGNLLRRYIHGADLKADDPIAWFEGSAFNSVNERQMRSDWEGSIVLIADQSGGTVLAVNRYDEYGIPQNTNAGRFQYTGQAWLPELGMYYYKARIYSPTLGRFLQSDPIGYKDQVNLYAYVSGDPINGVDFSGQKVEWLSPEDPTQASAGNQVLTYLQGSPTFSVLYQSLIDSKDTYYVAVTSQAEDSYNPDSRTITINPTSGLRVPSGIQSPALGGGHEFAHAERHDRDPAGYKADSTVKSTVTVDPDGAIVITSPVKPEENRATQVESRMAGELGEPQRGRYRDSQGSVPVDSPTTSCMSQPSKPC